VTQALLEAGTITAADAEHHRWRNVLLRYLGTKDGSQPCDVRELEPRAGDIYVLCSDGVLDGLDDPEIAAIARAEPNPEVAAKAIVAAALEGGSKDNITCVVVRVQ